MDEDSAENEDPRGVRQQPQLSENERLPNDDCHQSQVNRVAHVTVETSDDQMLRGCNRRRSANPFHHEAREGMYQHGRAEGDQNNAQHPKWKPVSERISKPPAREPPGHQTGDETRSQNEEDDAAAGGEYLAHVDARAGEAT